MSLQRGWWDEGGGKLREKNQDLFLAQDLIFSLPLFHITSTTLNVAPQGLLVVYECIISYKKTSMAPVSYTHLTLPTIYSV